MTNFAQVKFNFSLHKWILPAQKHKQIWKFLGEIEK